MSEPNTGGTNVAPAALRTARVILYIQGVVTLLGLVLVAVVVNSAIDHGQEVPGYTFPLAVLSLGSGVAAVVCAAMIVTRPEPWMRSAVMIIEAIAIFYGVFNVATGVLTGFVGIGLGIWVLRLISGADARDWIEGQRRARTERREPDWPPDERA